MARLTSAIRETPEIEIVFRVDDPQGTRLNRNAAEIYGKNAPLYYPELDTNMQRFLEYQIRKVEITPSRSLNPGETKYPYTSTSFPSSIVSDFNYELGNSIKETFPTVDIEFNKLIWENNTAYPFTIPAIGLSNGVSLINRYKIDGTRTQSGEGDFLIGLGGTILKATEIKLSPFTRLKISNEFGRDHQSPTELNIDTNLNIFGYRIDPRKYITTPDVASFAKSYISSTGITYYALNPLVKTPGTLDPSFTTQGQSGLIDSQITQEWFQNLDSKYADISDDTGTNPYYSGTNPSYTGYLSTKYRKPKNWDVIAYDKDNDVFRSRDILDEYIIPNIIYNGPYTFANVSSLTTGDNLTAVTNKLSYILDLISPGKPDLIDTASWRLSSVAPTQIGYPPLGMNIGSSITFYSGTARHTKTNLPITWTNYVGTLYASLLGTTGNTLGFWNDNSDYSSGWLYTADWSTASPTTSRTIEEANFNAGVYSGYTPNVGSLINGTVSTVGIITGPIQKRNLTSQEIVFNTGGTDSSLYPLATLPNNPFGVGTSYNVVTSNIYNQIWIQLWNALKFNVVSGPDPYYIRFGSYTTPLISNKFSNAFRFLVDNTPNITPTATTSGVIFDYNTINTVYVSGVPVITTGSKLRNHFKINNFAKWLYPSSVIAVSEGTPPLDAGLPGSGISPTDQVSYNVSTTNQYITGSTHYVNTTYVSATDVIPDSFSVALYNTVQANRWRYPYTGRVIATSYAGTTTTTNNLCFPTGPSEMIVDSISDIANVTPNSIRVSSGRYSISSTPTYSASASASTFGASYDHSQNININGNIYSGELMLYRNRWQFLGNNWTNLIPTAGPNYSVNNGETFRWATFKLATITAQTSYTCRIKNFTGTITLDTNNQITNISSSNLKIEACVIGSTTTPWFNLNQVVVGNPTNAGDGCLFSTGSGFSGSDLVRIISFGSSAKTGDVYVRVGFSSSLSNMFGGGTQYYFERIQP